MTTVSILPIPTDNGISYQAIAADKKATGRTAGEALDALTPQLPPEQTNTLIILHSQNPDQFFTLQQQERLAELMDLWRHARDNGQTLPPEQQDELEQLMEAELNASTQRTIDKEGTK
ncbi:MAG TPA: hypothetical protein VLL52_06050 [Anaerolineae bacterium]|nr:hypothetical protein [Anaerolineae bacterium]